MWFTGGFAISFTVMHYRVARVNQGFHCSIIIGHVSIVTCTDMIVA